MMSAASLAMSTRCPPDADVGRARAGCVVDAVAHEARHMAIGL